MDFDPVAAFFDLSVAPPRLFASTGQHSGDVVVPIERQFPLPNALDRPLLGPAYADEAKALDLVDLNQKEWKETLGYVVNRDCMSGVDDLTSVGTTPTLVEPDSDACYNKYDFEVCTVPQSLPIAQFQSQIVQMVKSYQTTILKGSTGCGKSTQVPQYILNYCYRQRAPCNIIVTQPRRIAARSLAQRVCMERGWELGSLVGYQIGLDREHISTDTRITYCTTGVLLQILVKEKSLDRYTHILIDEVHERSQDMDFVLALIKKFLRVSPGVKVILMSATINVERFAVYFGTYPRTGAAITSSTPVTPASIIDLDKGDKSLSATPFRLEVFYLEQVLQDSEYVTPPEEPGISGEMYKAAVNLIIGFDYLEKAGRRATCGAVLVFLPGIHEIEHLFSLLSNENENGAKRWVLKPLHSMLTNEDQVSVFAPTPHGYRKIILSTNIAESSVTVPDVAYVVDFMLTKHLICDNKTNFSSLQLAWASKSSCVQRAGRSGRTCPGRVYRLVYSDAYKDFLLEDKPEMLRGPLERVITQAKALDMGDPRHIIGLTLDPPDGSNFNKAVLSLKEKGALLPTVNGVHSWKDGDLTFLGRMMSQLPVDPSIAKLIMLGHVFSCLNDCIIMGAAMTMKSMFSNPFRKPLSAYHNRLSWANGSTSDPISFLNAYKTWIFLTNNSYFRRSAGDGEKQWAERNLIEIRAMHEVHELVQDLTRRLDKAGIQEPRGNARIKWAPTEGPLILKVVLAGAFYPNYCGRGEQGGQVDELNAVKTLNGLSPYTTVYFGGLPTDQPKELYNQTIKSILKDCAHEMMVSYDGSSKAYVQFAESDEPGIRVSEQKEFKPNIPGKVVMGVYRAVKMRQLNLPVMIPMLRSADAWRRARELGLEDNSNESWVFNRKPVPLNTLELPKKSKLESHMEIDITYKVDAGHFWARNKSTGDSLRNIEWIQKKLKDPTCVVPLTHKPVVGNVYPVLYDDPDFKSEYFRARITSNRNKYEVHFIDFGNSQQVLAKSIGEFHPSVSKEMMDIEPLAFECVLSNISPSIMKNQTGLWTNEAQKAFDNLTSDADLYGTVYSIVQGVVSLDLQALKRRVGSQTQEKSVAKNLIAQGYGEYAEESYLSKRNREFRERSVNSTNDETELPEEPKFIKQLDLPSPSEEECHLRTFLRGPTSPLEMKVYSMTRGGVRREVVIDMMSVNSVLLDTDPHDRHERLIVAASIGENAAGNRITLRHTTLMPNLHGFPALMCLLFAPRVEFRVNRQRTLYTGALCGLGFNQERGLPAYAENDMEIVFDTQLNSTDMELINSLRFWMNRCFVNEDGNADVFRADPTTMLQSKTNVKDIILTLLRVQRKSQDLSMPLQPNVWNLIEQKNLLNPFKDPGMLAMNERRGVFQLHWGVVLDISPEERTTTEYYLENAHELRLLVKRSENMGAWKTCVMCRYTTPSGTFMKEHLSSHAHMTRENSYRVRIGMQTLSDARLI